MDVYLYPDDLEKSGWLSALIGYGGFLVIVTVQAILNGETFLHEILKGKTFKSKFMLAFFNYLIAFLGVSCWRSIWVLQDVYLLKEDRKSSAWMSHCLGTALLMILLHFQSTFAAPLLILSEYDNQYKINNLIRSPSIFNSSSSSSSTFPKSDGDNNNASPSQKQYEVELGCPSKGTSS